MTERLSVRIDESRLNRLGMEFASEGARVFAEEVAEEARRLCPVDSGHLRSKIKVRKYGLGWVVMADTEYAIYVHEGTGKYARGGYGRTTAWVYTPDGGRTFYTTEGQRPQPFLTQALDIVTARWGGDVV